MNPSYRGLPALQCFNFHAFDLCHSHIIDRPSAAGFFSCLCGWAFIDDRGQEWIGAAKVRA